MKINIHRKRTLLAVLLILLAGGIIYSNTFQGPFVLDDQSSIVDNIAIKALGNLVHGYELGLKFLQNRIVVYLTFALNHHFGGLDVAGYHAVNLLIHLVTAVLVYALLRLTFLTPYFMAEAVDFESETASQTPLLTPRYVIPLFAALLFVVHPVQTQAVTYIVQRMTSLTTLFYLLSISLYVRARLAFTPPGTAAGAVTATKAPSLPGARIRIFSCYAGAIVAALLAMKSKEIAFTLPLAIVLYEIFFFRGPWKRRLLFLLPILATLPIIPLTIMGFLDLGIDEQTAAAWQPTHEEPLRVGTSISRLDYLLTQFRVIVTYLRLLIWPVNQNLDYDYPVFSSFFTPEVFLSCLLLTGIFALGLLLFWNTRWPSWEPSERAGPAAHGIKTSLTSRQALRLASFGILWFFLTLSVESSIIPIKDVIMEYRLYLPFFGVATVFTMIFHLLLDKCAGRRSGTLSLLSATVLVLLLGGATYQRNHVWGSALSLWQDVVDKSPNKARPVNNLGSALEKAGRRTEAIQAFSRAIKLDPTYYKAYYNLADLYLVSGQPEKSLPLLQTAIGLKADFIEAYVAAGAALMRAGKFREVTIFLEQNLDRIADNAEARFYLGASYAFMGNREAAMRELATLAKLDKSYAANLAGMLRMNMSHGVPNGGN